MWIDLGFLKIKFGNQFLILHFLPLGFQFKPINRKPKHSNKNYDEQRNRNNLNDEKAGVEILYFMCVSINQIALKIYTGGKESSKRHRKFQQVPQNAFAFNKSGPGYEVVQISNQHGKH